MNHSTQSDPPPEQPTFSSAARTRLRAETRVQHDAAEENFGQFTLSDRKDYGGFLTAQARALSTIERAAGGTALWPQWQPREPFLRADLADLGLAMPDPLPFAGGDDDAYRWGMVYVLEGSRLGGAVLVQRVQPGMPNRFLSAKHGPGNWRTFLAALDEAAEDQGNAWLDRAVAGATDAFGLFQQAAIMTLKDYHGG